MSDEELRCWAIERVIAFFGADAAGAVKAANALIDFVRPDATVETEKWTPRRVAILRERFGAGDKAYAIVPELNLLPGPKITAEQARHYANRVLKLRHHGSPEQIERVREMGRRGVVARAAKLAEAAD